jgi:hypothetical protein
LESQLHAVKKDKWRKCKNLSSTAPGMLRFEKKKKKKVKILNFPKFVYFCYFERSFILKLYYCLLKMLMTIINIGFILNMIDSNMYKPCKLTLFEIIRSVEDCGREF